MRVLLLFILLCLASTASAQYPDGTLVFSSKQGLVGNVAKRITGGDQYTHVGIVIDGLVYESDWPRARAIPVSSYGKPRTTNDFYVPEIPYSDQEVAQMRSEARANLGKPYRLRNYFRPGTKQTDGTWCSPYSADVVRASGRFQISSYDGYEPQNLLRKVSSGYRLQARIKK